MQTNLLTSWSYWSREPWISVLARRPGGTGQSRAVAVAVFIVALLRLSLESLSKLLGVSMLLRSVAMEKVPPHLLPQQVHLLLQRCLATGKHQAEASAELEK